MEERYVNITKKKKCLQRYTFHSTVIDGSRFIIAHDAYVKQFDIMLR